LLGREYISVYAGIDLAAKEKNPTGFCVICSDTIFVQTIFLDNQIIELINEFDPIIIAIDAPLITGEINIRKADKLMKKYGAMPLTMPSMKLLTRRATKLAHHLQSNGYKVIEVFPTATAKILGFYEKNYKKSLNKINMESFFNNKHEYDSYLCSLTAQLYHNGKTTQIGDRNQYIVVPTEKK
jgi:hypothetical protein